MGVKAVEIPKGSGKWHIRINWRRKRKCKLVGNRDRAIELADRLKLALELYGADAFKIVSGTRATEMPTLKEYAERWARELEHSDKKLSTRRMYRSNLKIHIIPALGHKELDAIDYKTVKEFLVEKSASTYSSGRFRKRKRDRRYKPSEDRSYSRDTIRVMIMTLRAIFREAVRERLVAENPVRDLSQFYRRRKREREVSRRDVYTLEELYLVEDTLRAHRRLFGDSYEFSLLLSRTGMRIGEARAIRASDLDMEARTISVQRNIPSGTDQLEETTKTEWGRRVVAMSEDLYLALGDLEARRREVAMRTGSRTEQERLFMIRYDSFHKDWKRAQRMAGIRIRSPHSLRHTWASHMLQGGADIAYVSRQLGHSSPAVTLGIYTHFVPGRAPAGRIVLDRAGRTNANAAQMEAKTAEFGGKREKG